MSPSFFSWEKAKYGVRALSRERAIWSDAVSLPFVRSYASWENLDFVRRCSRWNGIVRYSAVYTCSIALAGRIYDCHNGCIGLGTVLGAAGNPGGCRTVVLDDEATGSAPANPQSNFETTCLDENGSVAGNGPLERSEGGLPILHGWGLPPSPWSAQGGYDHNQK